MREGNEKAGKRGAIASTGVTAGEGLADAEAEVLDFAGEGDELCGGG